MKRNIINIVLNIVLSIVTIVMLWVAPFYLWISICGSVASVAVLVVSIVLLIKKNGFYNSSFIINCLITFFAVLFAIFFFTGLIEHFRDIESAREWFASFGVVSWLMLLLIQLLQVVVLPIPAQITTVAGVLIFGPLQCFCISSVAVIIGSVICFAIGKWFGIKVAYKMADKEVVDKYRALLNKKGKVLLPLAFLLPCFPDDLLCFVAGATTMTYKYFITITILTRLVGVAGICWLGSGDFIPFSGWGIPVWIVIGVVSLIAMFLLLKYQDNIENWIVTKIMKKPNKDSHDNNKDNNDNDCDDKNKNSQGKNNTSHDKNDNDNSSGSHDGSKDSGDKKDIADKNKNSTDKKDSTVKNKVSNDKNKYDNDKNKDSDKK